MNLHEFYNSLRTIKDKFSWEITPNQEIRAYNEDGVCFCPLTAIYQQCTGVYVPVDHVDIAWKWLEIIMDDAEYIVVGADHNTAPANNDMALRVRKEMKSILGFE